MIPVAVREGLGLLRWQQDSLAYADACDEATDRYRGSRCGVLVAFPAVSCIFARTRHFAVTDKEIHAHR